MNKKLATLLFAIGLGTASAAAVAGPCQYWCHYGRTTCESQPGSDPATCSDAFLECMEYCQTTWE
jgi:hypothetical protein